MKLFVASQNPVKINAVKQAVAEHLPDSPVEGLEAASDIAAQPMSDEETRQGAINRARNLRQRLLTTNQLQEGEEALFIGLEGGVFLPEFATTKTELWSTVWAAVLDQDGQLFLSNGARFPVPEFLAEMLLSGQEMGPSLGTHVGDLDLRQKSGMIGFVTKNFTNRTEEYANIVKIAIGLWYGSQNN